MLAIRLQRIGRTGHAMYRVAIQESHRHPSSGRVVAYIGSYDPHTKKVNIQSELAQKYLDNGAQPTPRVVKLLKEAGVKLPKWVKEPSVDKNKSVRHTEKLRKNRPIEEVAETVIETPEVPVEETIKEESAPVEVEAKIETEATAPANE